MKATNHFKNTIKAYLDKEAEKDVLFSFHYTNPDKDLDSCITYILNTVQTSGCQGFVDNEIFGMAVHYYTESNIEVGKPMNAHVVVNHAVILTEEEKQEARKQAIEQLQNETYHSMKKPQKRAVKTEQTNIQPSLFD